MVKRKRVNRRRSTRAVSKVDKKQQRQINALLRNTYRWSQYKYSYAAEDTPDAHAIPVIAPNDWIPIFASNNRSDNTDRAFLKKIRFNFNVTVNSSGLATVAPMHYTIFLVSIRKEFVMQTFARAGNQLQTLTQNLDYMEHTLGATVGSAQWQLNPTIYKVHARRQGMVGNFATEGPLTAPEEDETAAKVSNIRDANRNHTIMMPWNRRLQRGIGQTTQPSLQLEWRDMQVHDINGHDQLYVFFFNNATQTQSVSLHWSAQIMCKVPE